MKLILHRRQCLCTEVHAAHLWQLLDDEILQCAGVVEFKKKLSLTDIMSISTDHD